MTIGDSASHPAFPAFALDIMSNVLMRAADPGELSEHLTEEMRELSGARLVVILQCRHEMPGGGHRVMAVTPRRRRPTTESVEIDRLAEIGHDLTRVTLWHHHEEAGEAEAILSGLGFGLSMAVPLQVGSFRVGSMLLLHHGYALRRTQVDHHNNSHPMT